jgi:hypothetical protein
VARTNEREIEIATRTQVSDGDSTPRFEVRNSRPLSEGLTFVLEIYAEHSLVRQPDGNDPWQGVEWIGPDWPFGSLDKHRAASDSPQVTVCAHRARRCIGLDEGHELFCDFHLEPGHLPSHSDGRDSGFLTRFAGVARKRPRRFSGRAWRMNEDDFSALRLDHNQGPVIVESAALFAHRQQILETSSARHRRPTAPGCCGCD